MDSLAPWEDVEEAAAAIEADLRALPVRNTQTMRAVRRKYSHELRHASAEFVLQLAGRLTQTDSHRWIAFELIRAHPQTFRCIGERELEELGRGINSWWRVDEFARTLSGPAWLNGQISDDVIIRWAHSSDRWWRRAALVSTVAWNIRSSGGPGDLPKTMKVCRLLAKDHDDMVAKALSWALRELVVHDAAAVQRFLEEFEADLAARVKREVRNKLETGLKNPKGGKPVIV